MEREREEVEREKRRGIENRRWKMRGKRREKKRTQEERKSNKRMQELRQKQLQLEIQLKETALSLANTPPQWSSDESSDEHPSLDLPPQPTTRPSHPKLGKHRGKSCMDDYIHSSCCSTPQQEKRSAAIFRLESDSDDTDCPQMPRHEVRYCIHYSSHTCCKISLHHSNTHFTVKSPACPSERLRMICHISRQSSEE